MSKEFGNGLLSLSCVQFDPISAETMDDVRKNTDRILEYMDRAVCGNPGVDMIVFPECCFQGMSPVKWVEVGMKMDDENIMRVREKCKELDVWGAFNPWIKPDDGRFIENTAIMIDNEGNIVDTYVKMNPAISLEPTVPGREMKVIDGPKGAKIAFVICADGLYPECYREAAYKGANLVLHISHWMTPGEGWWELSNRAGAAFNGYWVVGLNSCCMDEAYSYFGKSMVVDPMGNVQYQANSAPGIFFTLIPTGSCAPMFASSMLWNSLHRGASCPDQDGVGLGYEDYTVYNQKK